jgi:hypothetical protein
VSDIPVEVVSEADKITATPPVPSTTLIVVESEVDLKTNKLVTSDSETVRTSVLVKLEDMEGDSPRETVGLSALDSKDRVTLDSPKETEAVSDALLTSGGASKAISVYLADSLVAL